MKSVGVRELKSHLSEYLKLVKKGEIIVITDHNKIVAEIRQPKKIKPGDTNTKHKIEDYLERLTKEGKLNKAVRAHSLIDSFKAAGKPPAGYNWKKTYSQSREDR